MFYYLRGTLAYKDTNVAVIDCGGVGYQVLTSAATSGAIEVGEEITLYTSLIVRQDAVELYGFATVNELATFKSLISVTGVGPKVAATILSSLTPEQFALAVVSSDIHALTSAPGVGPKLAQRISLELKDKIDKSMLPQTGGTVAPRPAATPAANSEEAVRALMVLGYSRHQAQQAVEECDASAPVETIVRTALRLLMK